MTKTARSGRRLGCGAAEVDCDKEGKMKTRLIGSVAVAVAALAAGTAGSADAASSTYFCTGTLVSGAYHRIVVPAGATCDGTDATVTVRGGVFVGRGGTFILGTEGGSPTGTINGGLVAIGAASVQLHFAHVNGGVFILGGNGFFSTVEDNVINGFGVIYGYSGFWLGFIRNTVHGTVLLSNNHMDDPDANEYVTNTIFGSLVCFGNSPAPQVGDSGGSPNQVSGLKLGQCAGL
jgi:hypothetical protein